MADAAPNGLTLYGQEKDNATRALAVMNMVLHGYATADIRQGDTITSPQFLDGNDLKTFDYLVANPPFSVKSWRNGLENEYGRFDGYGRPPEKNGDYAFLLHMVKSLKSTGKGAVILPHGVRDYRDLFRSLESAITEYVSGAFDGYAKKDVEGLLKDRVAQGREDLDEALERIRALVEPVAPPKGTLEYQHYFVASTPGDAAQIKANEAKRIELYKSVATLVRTYTALANDMEAAGYSAAQAKAIKNEVTRFVAVRDEVELGAGEKIDMSHFGAGMRWLLDTYIQASPSDKVATFEKGLVDMIVERGEDALNALPPGIRNNQEAAAETIVNNVRKTIVDERALNPHYYDRMSELLDALIEQRRQDALDYKTYLQKLLDLATKVGKSESDTVYVEWAQNGAQRALVDFAFSPPDLAIDVDKTVMREKEHGWVGNRMKERSLARELRKVLPSDFDRFDELFELVKARDEYR